MLHLLVDSARQKFLLWILFYSLKVINFAWYSYLRVFAMLEDIWTDIRTLISIYEKTKREYEEVSEQLRRSEDAAVRYREQIYELEKQVDSLKLRNAFLATSGDEEAKEKVDRLIREIDKCIAMLEK